MTTSSTRPPTPEGTGSVSGAPGLPDGFSDTFSSRYVETGELRLHAVIGGEGPPLLLVHGWPQTWYAWRMVMPKLAEDFEVIAVDQRGVGLSDKPPDGYDLGSLARDLVAMMDALGHARFAVYGTDTGMPIAHALAADHPQRVDRLVVSEAFLPGITPPLPLFVPPLANARLWHLMFNQLPGEVNEALVRGREGIFFGAEFTAAAGTTKLPDDTVRYYVDRLAADPEALRGSFGFYRAIPTSAAQNEERKARRLTMPVLAMGGEQSGGGLEVDAGLGGDPRVVRPPVVLVAGDPSGVTIARRPGPTAPSTFPAVTRTSATASMRPQRETPRHWGRRSYGRVPRPDPSSPRCGGPRANTLPTLAEVIELTKGIAAILGQQLTGLPYDGIALAEVRAGEGMHIDELGNPASFAHTIIDWYVLATGDFLHGTEEVARDEHNLAISSAAVARSAGEYASIGWWLDDPELSAQDRIARAARVAFESIQEGRKLRSQEERQQYLQDVQTLPRWAETNQSGKHRLPDATYRFGRMNAKYGRSDYHEYSWSPKGTSRSPLNSFRKNKAS